MSRTIIGPEIIGQRIEYMQGKSVWYYISVINQSLMVNPVEVDGTIDVKLHYNIDGDTLNQIYDFYISAGWFDIDIILAGSNDGLYGSTTFKFIPPETMIKSIRKKVRRHL